ncbi:hypothetical protein C8R43DRAFT_962138 [Mycena crocata]|nr:hypothetical protein C8R43DRAFT_962138 [Mycena crocata]
MASFRLPAVPGASLSIVPTPTGISFEMENSKILDTLQDPPAMAIILSPGPQGIRISVVQDASVGNEPPDTIPVCHSTLFDDGLLDSRDLTGTGDGGFSVHDQLVDQRILFPRIPSPATENLSGVLYQDPFHEFTFEDFNTSWNPRVHSPFGWGSSHCPASNRSLNIDAENATPSSYDMPSSPAPTSLPCRVVGCHRKFVRGYTRKNHEESHRKSPLSCSEADCSTTFSRSHDKLRAETWAAVPHVQLVASRGTSVESQVLVQIVLSVSRMVECRLVQSALEDQVLANYGNVALFNISQRSGYFFFSSNVTENMRGKWLSRRFFDDRSW